MKARTPRNYAATDTTLINLRAMKRTVAALDARVQALETRNRTFADRLQALEEGRPRPSRFLKRAK